MPSTQSVGSLLVVQFAFTTVTKSA